MDRIINLHDFYAHGLDERMAKARREFPGIKVVYVGRTQKGSTIATSPLHNGNSRDSRDLSADFPFPQPLAEPWK